MPRSPRSLSSSPRTVPPRASRTTRRRRIEVPVSEEVEREELATPVISPKTASKKGSSVETLIQKHAKARAKRGIGKLTVGHYIAIGVVSIGLFLGWFLTLDRNMAAQTRLAQKGTLGVTDIIQEGINRFRSTPSAKVPLIVPPPEHKPSAFEQRLEQASQELSGSSTSSSP